MSVRFPIRGSLTGIEPHKISTRHRLEPKKTLRVILFAFSLSSLEAIDVCNQACISNCSHRSKEEIDRGDSDL